MIGFTMWKIDIFHSLCSTSLLPTQVWWFDFIGHFLVAAWSVWLCDDKQNVSSSGALDKHSSWVSNDQYQVKYLHMKYATCLTSCWAIYSLKFGQNFASKYQNWWWISEQQGTIWCCHSNRDMWYKMWQYNAIVQCLYYGIRVRIVIFAYLTDNCLYNYFACCKNTYT